MSTVTKKDLVECIAERTGVKRTDVKAVIHESLEMIIEQLAEGNRLEFRDFGVFAVRERAARTAQHPKTLERVQVPPKRNVRFTAGRMMKVRVEEVVVEAPSTTHAATPVPAPAEAPRVRVTANLNHTAATESR